LGNPQKGRKGKKKGTWEERNIQKKKLENSHGVGTNGELTKQKPPENEFYPCVKKGKKGQKKRQTKRKEKKTESSLGQVG